MVCLQRIESYLPWLQIVQAARPDVVSEAGAAETIRIYGKVKVMQIVSSAVAAQKGKTALAVNYKMRKLPKRVRRTLSNLGCHNGRNCIDVSRASKYANVSGFVLPFLKLLPPTTLYGQTH